MKSKIIVVCLIWARQKQSFYVSFCTIPTTALRPPPSALKNIKKTFPNFAPLQPPACRYAGKIIFKLFTWPTNVPGWRPESSQLAEINKFKIPRKSLSAKSGEVFYCRRVEGGGLRVEGGQKGKFLLPFRTALWFDRTLPFIKISYADNIC